MTLHPLHAGDGYTYLTREVATADVRRERGEEMTSYYNAEGNPPGVWLGSGLDELYLDGHQVEAGQTVTEAQMKALFGEGLHPNADAIIQAAVDAGMDPEEAIKTARLGRAVRQYKAAPTFTERCEERYDAFKRMHHTAPDEDQRARLRLSVAGKMFTEQHGRRARDGSELKQFLAKIAKPPAQAVSGYDLVFSPSKSVSVLWALGDQDTRLAIEAAHEEAIASTVRWLEQNAVKTRIGVNGLAQVEVQGGVIAAAFRHYDSRSGDPQLHTHVAIGNRVKGPTGWVTLDGRALFKAKVAASEHYNAEVEAGVTRRLSVAYVDREAAPGLRPVREIAGVDPQLPKLFSSRSETIARRTADLIERHRREHGREPSAAVRYQLAQQATLEDRPPKQDAQSLAQHRDSWRAQAVQAVGRKTVDRLLRNAQAAAADAQAGIRTARAELTGSSASSDADGITTADRETEVNELAARTVRIVEEHRATWTRFHVEAEARRQAVRVGLGSDQSFVDAVSARALGVESIRLTPPELEPSLPDLRRRDGSSVFVHDGTVRYSSQRLFDAEQRVLAATQRYGVPPVSGERFDQVLARYEATHRALDPRQADMARAFATDGRFVLAGIGPAGAGKTTTMQVVARAIEDTGGRVIALAPSARAAAVLSRELGIPAHTMHAWIRARENGADGKQWQLGPGDVILIDEAGMAGTFNIDAVVRDAAAAGASGVRALGDPQQLAAPESGGLLRLIQHEAGAVELDALWRFANASEANATLALREGTPDAWRWYHSQDRIHHGDRDAMLDAVYGAWRQDLTAGRRSLMIAPTNDEVRRLNDRARAERIAAGEVLAVGVDLRDGNQAGVGDQIVTRKNDRQNQLNRGVDFVKNGDLWTVEKRHRDGSITVRHTEHSGRTRLSASYVAGNVELGYASTAHRAQGMTVDVVRALVDNATSRANAYVAMTRGRLSNWLYTITDVGEDVHQVLDGILLRSDAEASATEVQRTEFAAAEHLPTLVARYEHVSDIAANERHEAAVTAAYGGALARQVQDSDAWPVLRARLARAELSGWSVDDILKAAGKQGLEKADDPAAILAYRVNSAVERGARQPALQDRPLGGLSDAALRRLRGTAFLRLHDAETEAAWAAADLATLPTPVRVGRREHPAWPDRRHGHLTHTELADALRTAEASAREAAIPVAAARRVASEATDPQERIAAARARAEAERAALVARRELAGLRGEQQLRTGLNREDRARESAERLSPETPIMLTERLTVNAAARDAIAAAAERMDRAQEIIGRIDSESAVREVLPTAVREAEERVRQGNPVERGATGVPEWVADTRHLRDPATNKWRTHLEERREHIDQRLIDLARQVHAEQPEWAQQLGPRPDDGAAERWDRAASVAAAYRQLWRVPEEEKTTLGPEPRPAAQREAWLDASADVEPVRAAHIRARRAEAAVAAREKLRQAGQPAEDRTPEPANARRRAAPDTQRERQQDEARRQAAERTAQQQRVREEQAARQAERARAADEQRRRADQLRRDQERQARDRNREL